MNETPKQVFDELIGALETYVATAPGGVLLSYAVDGNEYVRRFNAAIEADRWIPVEERLPAVGDTVLFYIDRENRVGSVEAGWFDGSVWSTEAIHGEVGRYAFGEKVTHWQLLPEPPK